MLINKDWQQRNPINDILEPYESLLWIGRPDEEIYVQGRWRQHGVLKYWALSVVIFTATAICLFISSGFASRSVIPVLFFTLIVSFIPLAACVLLESKDYKKAPWYAFSEERIFLATWDYEGSNFVVRQTDLSNLRNVTVCESKTAVEEAKNIGNLVCGYQRSIQRRVSNHFVFELIDNPAEVKALLLDAKAVCVI